MFVIRLTNVCVLFVKIFLDAFGRIVHTLNMRKLIVTVRSMLDTRNANGAVAEWVEEFSSWQAAWRMIDDCGTDRANCRVWGIDASDKKSGIWYIDMR